MKREKVREAGFMFGVVCKYLGATASLICTPLTPRDGEKSICIGFLIATVISLSVFLYGVWRTGGVFNDDP